MTASSELVFPSFFGDWEKTVALRTLRGLAPVHAQMLIDEIAGRVAAGRVKWPISYLVRLVSSWRDGSFVPRYGVAVAKARTEARARAEAAARDALKAAVAEAEAEGAPCRDEAIERRREPTLAMVNPTAPSDVRAVFDRMIAEFRRLQDQKRRAGVQTERCEAEDVVDAED